MLLFSLHIIGTSYSQQQRAQNKHLTMETKKLTQEETDIIIDKGTEPPFSGIYNDYFEKGFYTCKQCGTPLFSSASKFPSHCGWPSFDDNIKNAVATSTDADGRRTEITCAHCGGHLGHVFYGEGFTEKDTRHCVNSLSIDFVSDNPDKYDTVYFASGCFWGTEYMFQETKGVISTRVGYIGGHADMPTYQQVCTGTTGHAEAVEVVYRTDIISYEMLAKKFFETHDPTQLNRQGPDIGEQYRSEIFYTKTEQKEVSERLIETLLRKGYAVATAITKAKKFYAGEAHHQKYYKRKGSKPYCHFYQKRF